MSPTASILLEALAPGILVIGALLVALPWLSPRDERARTVMVVVLVVLMWRYMFWRWFSTLPVPELSLDFAVGLIFVVIETLAVLGSTINLMFVSRLKDRSPDADRNLHWGWPSSRSSRSSTCSSARTMRRRRSSSAPSSARYRSTTSTNASGCSTTAAAPGCAI
jgi:hypothetical protein